MAKRQINHNHIFSSAAIWCWLSKNTMFRPLPNIVVLRSLLNSGCRVTYV